VSPNQVQLEITEGALMADPRRVLVTLHRLDKLGVALSLDDFGTGTRRCSTCAGCRWPR
jgi:EAL domain-containing protein (putative c-di-GMP-specific phosphodiesterase class I)